ncbi:glycosyltransferase family 2 protein [Chryseobacterium sp. PBS4-4]|uniref:Glycosyltransferase family 2 protein n=1 Tax=Chryseobacterium edaphi TaxID=2976532 RepID=A0ABT2W6F7_9FLAO|nr:glycosyltransferase family A protein [Chryseobacterium edaphi]MCU7616295.1 glycosyltransferase family 2 protein [Chryseobacterium edaphi]
MKNPTEHFSDSLFSQLKILPTVKSSIVIPVKDEETYILKTLSSFAKQIDLFGDEINPELFEILILANNCSDRSVAIIKDFQHNHPQLNIYLEEVTLSPVHANIGYVRRNLMECAYSRLCKNGGGIILTTDGDTMVAPDWISQTQQEIYNGAEVVGGRILLSEDELAGLDEFTLLHHLKDEKYQLLIAELEGKIINSEYDPVPRHHQHFNGSFAITTECYAKSGGVPVVNHLEDCAFFEKLEGIDAKIRHSHQVTVYTSARCIGRAEVGLSYQLNVWKNLGNHIDEYFVESCDSIVNRFTQKRKLMKLWKSKDVAQSDFNQIMNKIAPEIIVEEEIYTSFINTRYFGEWYRKVNQLKQLNSKNRFPAVHIDKAIEDLQTKVQDYSNHNFAQTSIL